MPSDPKLSDFLTKIQSAWGMDPSQRIDMNDPTTRLVMTIVIANLEQGRDIYSYDQYIKGCAMSAGIDPALYDQEVNPTTLGIENATSGAGGFVSPATTNVVLGGSSVPTMNISNYIQAGIQVSFNNNAIDVSNGVSVAGPGGFTGVVNVGSTGGFTGTGSIGVSGSAPALSGDDAAMKASVEAAIGQDRLEVGLPATLSDSEWAALKGATIAEGGDYSYNMAVILNRSYESEAPIDQVVFASKQFTTATGALTGYNDVLAGNDTAGFARFNNAALSPADARMGSAVANFQSPYDAGYNYFAASGYNKYGTDHTVLKGQDYSIGPEGNFSGGGAANVQRWNNYLSSNGKQVPSVDSTNTSGSLTNPDGLPGGEYKSSTYTTDDTGTYRTLTDKNGNEFYQYKDGSVYNSNDELVRPPNGVPSDFNKEEVMTVNGQEVNVYYKGDDTSKYYIQTQDGSIRDQSGNNFSNGPGVSSTNTPQNTGSPTFTTSDGRQVTLSNSDSERITSNNDLIKTGNDNIMNSTLQNQGLNNVLDAYNTDPSQRTPEQNALIENAKKDGLNDASSVQERINENNTEIAANQKMISDATTENQQLSSNSGTSGLPADIQSLNDQIADNDKNIADLQAQIDSGNLSGEALKDAESNIEDLRNQNEDLTNQMTDKITAFEGGTTTASDTPSSTPSTDDPTAPKGSEANPITINKAPQAASSQAQQQQGC